VVPYGKTISHIAVKDVLMPGHVKRKKTKGKRKKKTNSIY
jgi:hypothetical protein